MAESFSARCYALLGKVPAGKVTTYKILAEALGSRAYRAVGRAMATNPHPVEMPCHRVVKSNGEIGGYVSGKARKIALLEAEGVPVKTGRIVDLEARLYRFDP